MRELAVVLLAGTLIGAFGVAKKQETTVCDSGGSRMEMTTTDYRLFSSFQAATSLSYKVTREGQEKSSGSRLSLVFDDNVERGRRIARNFCSSGVTPDITKIKFGGP